MGSSHWLQDDFTKSSETSGLVQAAPDEDGTQTDDKDEMETDDDREQLRLEIWWLCTLAFIVF